MARQRHFMLKRIAVEDLRLGMHLHELCGSWLEHPFWRTKFVLTDPQDLQRIADCGIREVWIDSSLGIDVGGADVATRETVDAEIDATLDRAADNATAARSEFAEEIHRAAQICGRAKTAVVSMFNEARMGKAIDADSALPLVAEISDSVTRNPGAIVSLARLKTADEYTFMHSVAVCALMVALARQLGLDENDTRQAGLAGLLHDLGKALVPLDVLNKPGRLTDAEFTTVKRHPELGHALLLEGNSVGSVPLDVCLHHHEKIDGSGYPHRLQAEEITLFARMGAVCDVYDAITSNRPYKAGWDPAESVRKMAEWTKGHFDDRVFQAFVKAVGIYPVGALVRLRSGRMAVVVEQSQRSLLVPKVKAFFSTKANMHIPPVVVDLALPGASDAIVARVDPGQLHFPHLEELWAGDATPRRT